MPSSSILLGDRSRELNRRSATLRVESGRLNDQSVALRKKACALSIQEAMRLAPQSPAKEAPTSFSTSMKQEVLYSWKKIASYMGYGVRTIQRYEQCLGLPIRRFSGSSSCVSAFTSELDRWMQTAGTRSIGRTESAEAVNEIAELRAEVARLRKLTEELVGCTYPALAA